jgi:hypothetical protein
VGGGACATGGSKLTGIVCLGVGTCLSDYPGRTKDGEALANLRKRKSTTEPHFITFKLSLLYRRIIFHL